MTTTDLATRLRALADDPDLCSRPVPDIVALLREAADALAAKPEPMPGELPPPYAYIYVWHGHLSRRLSTSSAPYNGRVCDEAHNIYTADQMRAYACAAVEASRAALAVPNLGDELERAYRCIQGMHHALTTGGEFNLGFGYHSPTIAAAKRFVFEGALDGSEYFIGKSIDVLHAALRLPAPTPGGDE